MTAQTSFESDILGQPAALRALAGSPLPDLSPLTSRDWDRIVFTGMGSSGCASISTWRNLIENDHPCWNIVTSELLDNLHLLTSGTLLVITSQSGASGEVIELLKRCAGSGIRPGLVVGVTNDPASELATAADLCLPLHSGPEATVSTKSYLNSLAVHRRITETFGAGNQSGVTSEILATAEAAARTIEQQSDLASLAHEAATRPARRLAYIGRGDDGATARFAGLITKEAAKIPAEGFVGGQFRHGPFELAGDGLTVVVFGLQKSSPNQSLLLLSQDLVNTGAQVILVGGYELAGATTIAIPDTTVLTRLATSAVVAELFAVSLARANGVVPGQFRYGSKITTAV